MSQPPSLSFDREASHSQCAEREPREPQRSSPYVYGPDSTMYSISTASDSPGAYVCVCVFYGSPSVCPQRNNALLPASTRDDSVLPACRWSGRPGVSAQPLRSQRRQVLARPRPLVHAQLVQPLPRVEPAVVQVVKPHPGPTRTCPPMSTLRQSDSLSTNRAGVQ